jgi:hypothetical protein
LRVDDKWRTACLMAPAWSVPQANPYTSGTVSEEQSAIRKRAFIHAVKLILARCWFDAEKCKHGLHALRHYRRRFNTVSNEFTKDPVHDFASHAADALRGFASRYQQPREKLQPGWGSVSTSPFG